MVRSHMSGGCATGPSLSHCDHDLLQEEQHQEFLQLQVLTLLALCCSFAVTNGHEWTMQAALVWPLCTAMVCAQ